MHITGYTTRGLCTSRPLYPAPPSPVDAQLIRLVDEGNPPSLKPSLKPFGYLVLRLIRSTTTTDVVLRPEPYRPLDQRVRELVRAHPRRLLQLLLDERGALLRIHRVPQAVAGDDEPLVIRHVLAHSKTSGTGTTGGSLSVAFFASGSSLRSSRRSNLPPLNS